MTAENTSLTHFSLISRLFGNLFFRSPDDPILSGVFAWLEQQGLSPIWVLESDSQSAQAMAILQSKQDLSALSQEYRHLFQPEQGAVSAKISDYGVDIAAFSAFRAERGMPPLDSADHFGLVLLTASWIEDHSDSLQAQQQCFEQFLLPCAAQFLGKVEAHARLPFYRALAQLCREILAAMAEELEEEAEAAPLE